ncbi:MAG TPA: AAA family ATPase [Bacillota bacterium]
MRVDLAIGAGLGLLAFVTVTGGLDHVAPLLLVLAVAAALVAGGPLRGVPPGLRAGASGSRPRSGVTFDDIGGQGTAKRELREALDFVRDRDAAARMGIRPLRGILLTGPPGTGKTLLAKAAATYTGSTFLGASGSEFVEVYAGVGAQRVRSLFQRARRAAREAASRSAVLFIDELEVVGGRRGRHITHLEYDQTLNQLLVEMDGLDSGDDGEQVVVIGATNRVDLLDEALLRPGRFDRVVRVDLPDRRGRREILALHLRGRPLADDVDIDRLARETYGFSGAHLEAVANEAAILAWRQGCSSIEFRHLSEAVDKVLVGERAERRPSDEERRRVAFHEAGHALLGELVQPGSVASVTIVSRGASLGYVRQRPQDDVWLWTRDQLENDARVALAGYVAEQLVFGAPSTGAGDDLRRVADTVDRIITAGLSRLGPVDPDRAPPEAVQQVRSELTAVLVDDVEQILIRHRAALDRLAARLFEQETLSGDEVRATLESPAVGASESVAVAPGRTPAPTGRGAPEGE